MAIIFRGSRIAGTGKPGESAYEAAKKSGYKGTEEEFAAGLNDATNFDEFLTNHNLDENAHPFILELIDEKIEAIPTPDVSGQINTHDIDPNAHADIRAAIESAAEDKVPLTRTVNGKALNVDISLDAADVGALSADTEIPSALADLTDDSTHRVVTDEEKATWNAKSNFSGSYKDLADQPSIPSIEGLATEQYVDSAIDEINYPVYSVNGKTGAVVLSANDVGAPTVAEMNTAIASIPTPDVSGQINTHNSATGTHTDIRTLIDDLTNRLNAIADSDDITLDQLSEIVAYIKSNKSLIDSITTSKVNVSDIVNDLVTNVSNKPLSAAQGVALKALIDTLTTAVNSLDKADVGLGNVDNTADANKPVSTVQATAIADAKKAGTDAQKNLDTHINNKSNPHGVTAAQVGAPTIEKLNTHIADKTKHISRFTRNGLYTGQEIWYFPFAKLPVDDGSNYCSIIVNGRIGFWTASGLAKVDMVLTNRGGIYGAGAIRGNAAGAFNYCDIVIYKQDDNSAIAYLKTYYCAEFDISVDYVQATNIFDDTYTLTPSGTLVWSLSTANSIVKSDMDGNIYTNGGIMTGALTLNGDPTDDLHAATKKYVDDGLRGIPTVPTKVSAFTNDAGYITGYTETDPTVPTWAKASTKPSYTASEVGAEASGAVSTHNSSTSAHSDIRTLISNITGGTTTVNKATNATNIHSSPSTNKAYILGTTTTGTGNKSTVYNASVYTQDSVLFGAAWNDYAEYRIADCCEPGRVICENGDDTLSLAIERLQSGANVISDTFGFAIGETEKAKTPIAVSGRVLVYTFEDRNEFKPGDAVCAAPYGTVSLMTREEIMMYPERIVGTVSAVPTYETWGENNIFVNNRIWIKVK